MKQEIIQEIGVRDLNRNSNEIVHRIYFGKESFYFTYHGKLAAKIVPPTAADIVRFKRLKNNKKTA